jgi:hypothetical protein
MSDDSVIIAAHGHRLMSKTTYRTSKFKLPRGVKVIMKCVDEPLLCEHTFDWDISRMIETSSISELSAKLKSNGYCIFENACPEVLFGDDNSTFRSGVFLTPFKFKSCSTGRTVDYSSVVEQKWLARVWKPEFMCWVHKDRKCEYLFDNVMYELDTFRFRNKVRLSRVVSKMHDFHGRTIFFVNACMPIGGINSDMSPGSAKESKHPVEFANMEKTMQKLAYSGSAKESKNKVADNAKTSYSPVSYDWTPTPDYATKKPTKVVQTNNPMFVHVPWTAAPQTHAFDPWEKTNKPPPAPPAAPAIDPWEKTKPVQHAPAPKKVSKPAAPAVDPWAAPKPMQQALAPKKVSKPAAPAVDPWAAPKPMQQALAPKKVKKSAAPAQNTKPVFTSKLAVKSFLLELDDFVRKNMYRQAYNLLESDVKYVKSALKNFPNVPSQVKLRNSLTKMQKYISVNQFYGAAKIMAQLETHVL